MRKSYLPLRPDLDSFLFSAVGDERNGIPLSIISMLTRLGLDPWNEAARLSSLNQQEAVEQLARLIAEVPGASRTLEEARQISSELVERLPKFDTAETQKIKRPRCRRWPASPPGHRLAVSGETQFFVLCLVIGTAALLSILLHGGL